MMQVTDEAGGHSDVGTPSLGVLFALTVDSPFSTGTSGCSAFAMVASGWRPHFAQDATTGTDERDDVCLLAGDETVEPGITDQRRVAAERAEQYLEVETFTNKSARSVLSL